MESFLSFNYAILTKGIRIWNKLMQKKETQNCTYVFLEYELTYSKKGTEIALTCWWYYCIDCNLEQISIIVYPTATWELKDY